MAELSAKHRKWLDLIKVSSGGMSSRYPGIHVDKIPPKAMRLFERLGYVEIFIPHNPVHKDRVIITYRGEEALAESPPPGSST